MIRDTLQAALDAGWDDLVACADSACCPLPIAAIGDHPETEGRQA